MEESNRRRIKLAIPVRVRGMTSENKYFDEQVETVWIGSEVIVIRLQSLLDLDTEVHLMSLRTNVGAAFRTIWLNTQPVDGFRVIGLELVESEGDLWATDLPNPPPETEDVIIQTWLECLRCHQKDKIPLPEVPREFIGAGLVVERNCGRCKATTAWGFTQPAALPEEFAGPTSPAQAGELAQSASGAGAKYREEQRRKGRAPLRMPIKVIKRVYGSELADVGETINISRSGVYFRTLKIYEVGETVHVLLPYKEGDIAIPVPAKVVRRDQLKEPPEKGVALHFQR